MARLLSPKPRLNVCDPQADLGCRVERSRSRPAAKPHPMLLLCCPHGNGPEPRTLRPQVRGTPRAGRAALARRSGGEVPRTPRGTGGANARVPPDVGQPPAGRKRVTAFLADWLTVFVVAGLAMVSPGPNYAVTLKHSLLGSRRSGVWSAVGVAAGNLLHVVLSLLGLAVIVSQSILLFNALKWFGAAYLVYLGVRGLLARGYDEEETGTAESGEDRGVSVARAFRSSFLVSVLNPKVTLFYLVLFALVALFVSHRTIRDRFRAVAHWVERATGAVLVALGVRLAFSRAGD